MMLTEQPVLLTGPSGRRAASGLAAGAVATLLMIVVAPAFFGRAISLPTAPTLGASLDLILGLALAAIVVALVGAGVFLIARGIAKRASRRPGAGALPAPGRARRRRAMARLSTYAATTSSTPLSSSVSIASGIFSSTWRPIRTSLAMTRRWICEVPS